MWQRESRRSREGGKNNSGKLRHGPPINHSKIEGDDLSQNTFAVEG